MKIEMLEDVLHGREKFVAGEVRVVDEALGGYFCKAGWAKDLDGAVATGERDTREVILAPASTTHDTTAQGV